MKTLISTLTLFLLLHIGKAQQPAGIKLYAFFTESIGGMPMIDEEGRRSAPQPIIERLIYLECRCTVKPLIDSVFYNNVLFKPQLTSKPETNYKIGLKKLNQQPVTLTPKKGFCLWKVDLQQSTEKVLPNNQVKKIIVKGRTGKLKFTKVITAEMELWAPERY